MGVGLDCERGIESSGSIKCGKFLDWLKNYYKVKGKAVPLQAWTAPEGSRKLRFPRLHDNGTGWW